MKLVFTLLGFWNLSLCLTRRGNDFNEEEILQEKETRNIFIVSPAECLHSHTLAEVSIRLEDFQTVHFNPSITH